MLRAFSFRALLGLLTLLMASRVQAIEGPWMDDPEQAFRLAQQQNRLVLLHFWNETCPPCRRVETFVFTNGQVISALEQDFIAVKVNTNEYPELVRRYRVERIPQDFVFRPDGQMISQVTSPQNARDYVSMLSQCTQIAAQPNGGAELRTARALAYNDPTEVPLPPSSARRVSLGDTRRLAQAHVDQTRAQAEQYQAQMQQIGDATVVQAQQSIDQSRQQGQAMLAQGEQSLEQARMQGLAAIEQGRQGLTDQEANARARAAEAQRQAMDSVPVVINAAPVAQADAALNRAQDSMAAFRAQVMENPFVRPAASPSGVAVASGPAPSSGPQAASVSYNQSGPAVPGPTSPVAPQQSTPQQPAPQQPAAGVPSTSPAANGPTMVPSSPSAGANTSTRVPIGGGGAFRPGQAAPNSAPSPSLPAVRVPSSVPVQPQASPAVSPAAATTPAPSAPVNPAASSNGSSAPQVPQGGAPVSPQVAATFSPQQNFVPPVGTPQPAFNPGSPAAPQLPPQGASVPINRPPYAMAPQQPVVPRAPMAQTPETMSDDDGAVSEGQVAAGPTVGLYGFCPVTLISNKSWQDGDRSFGCEHRGRIYLFSDAAHRDEFMQNPDKYAPVLSGYDPVVFVEQGRLVEGRREHGRFVDGRIVLFSSEETFQQFERDSLRYIAAVRAAMEASDRVRR